MFTSEKRRGSRGAGSIARRREARRQAQNALLDGATPKKKQKQLLIDGMFSPSVPSKPPLASNPLANRRGSRGAVATALVEALRCDAAKNRDFGVKAKEGREFPDAAAWARMFESA